MASCRVLCPPVSFEKERGLLMAFGGDASNGACTTFLAARAVSKASRLPPHHRGASRQLAYLGLNSARSLAAICCQHRHWGSRAVGHRRGPRLAGEQLLLARKQPSSVITRFADPQWLWLRCMQKPQRCADCFGTTTILCKACGARGRVGGVFSGEQPQRCATCDGLGRVQCPRCRGAGMKNSWLWRTDMTMYRTGPQSSHPYRTGRDRGHQTEHDTDRDSLLKSVK